MLNKPTLSFYTNIPTPYQLSFFLELAKLFHLKVIYYSATESNREWNFNLNQEYEVTVLKNSSIANFIQKRVVDFHFSWQIFKVAWNDSSDYIIVGGGYWIPNAAVPLFISRIKSKKVAYFTEPLFEVQNKVKHYLKWFLLRILSITCDAIFCIGKKAADSFEAFGVNTAKFIIPYNIDSKSFANTGNDKHEAFKSKYKGKDELIILSSGSLIERKGMDILIKAVQLINNPDLKLIIIGDGPLKKELIDISGDDKRIIFAGFQNPADIPGFFAIADVFAFASRYDGWAVVINEAIAANVPIISSDKVGAAIELLTSPELGILCESDNVECFKKAIEGLCYDTLRRNKIKEASRSLIPLVSSDYYAAYVYDIFINQLQ